MKKYLQKLFEDAAKRLPFLSEVELQFDTPKIETHGDLSSNAAMLLSKKLKKNPRELAAEILSNLEIDKNIISKTEIAGPGFINFYFTPSFISEIIKDINEGGDDFGKSKKYSGKRANVEFVSANPTGPLTVGHGRGAVTGDTIAKMLEWIGYEVDREYYFNNAGRQMRVLGDSVRIRYLNLLGKQINYPEDYYQGEYLIDISRRLKEEFGNKLLDEPAEGKFKEAAESEIFNDIKKSLNRIGVNHKIFFNEKSLYEDGKIDDLLQKFKASGLSYEKDGAVWLKLSQMTGGEDKVIVKATGEPTYRLPDIAYHAVKYDRGYDLMVDLFGSDHNATYPDVLAGIKALGYDDSKVKVLIHQFVTILKDGQVVKMSTRKANYITLDELTDEVGSDVVRYFFNMRTISSHMNFDIDLAKKQSDENPVFYLQYAHARICSIIRTVESENLKPSMDNLNLLIEEEEQGLLKKLHKFEEEVLYSAENYEPQKICAYLEDLASAFHKFYTFRRILGSEKNIAEARLALAVATRTVIKNGLTILGVSAPEKM
ncbi:MAG TPA: arginine--tRNA ligase [Ignavibacteriaceae bacterium]|nr:arginine--tRNA ligase [Ignavibacteriaceae bacterium]